MVKEIYDRLVHYLPSWSYARPVVYALGIIGAGLLYINLPNLPIIGGPVIRLTQDNILIDLNPSTNYCEIYFRHEARFHPYVMTLIKSSASAVISQHTGKEIEVTNPTSNIRIFPNQIFQKSELNSSENIIVDIRLLKGQSAEISKVVIDGKTVNIPDFHKKYVKTAAAELITTRSVRNDVSIIIKKYKK